MKKLIILFSIISSILLSGCWDMRDINEVALVMAVGIDKVDNSDKFLITAQIAKQGEGGSSPVVSGPDPVWTATAEGDSLFDAIRNLAKISSRRIMWAHNNIIIIGESLAKEDITPVIDFFTHNRELRMQTWIAVSEGKASDYVTARTGLEKVPAMSIGQVFRYSKLPAESLRSDMLRLFPRFLNENIEFVMAKLKLRDQLEGTDHKGEGEK